MIDTVPPSRASGSYFTMRHRCATALWQEITIDYQMAKLNTEHLERFKHSLTKARVIYATGTH